MDDTSRDGSQSHTRAHSASRRRNGSSRHWRTLRRHVALALAYAGELPCTRCHEPVRYGQPFHLDHIQPLAEGGTDTPTNLGVAHPACNTRHGQALRNPAQRTPEPSRAW